MARRWGKVDYRQLKKLQERMQKLEKIELEKFCEAMAKELAAIMLAKVIKRTPVADPSKWKKPVKDYVGGTLRRGWTAGKQHWTETEDGKTRIKGIGGKTGFAQSMTVTKKGDVYEIEVVNNVHYASYVEYGRRTRDHKGWVPGRFMMTISADELQKDAPKIIEKKLIKLIGDAMNGN